MTTEPAHLPTRCHAPPIPNPDGSVVRPRVEDVWGVNIRKTYRINIIIMILQSEYVFLCLKVVYMNITVIGSCYQLSPITRKSNRQDLGV